MTPLTIGKLGDHDKWVKSKKYSTPTTNTKHIKGKKGLFGKLAFKIAQILF